MVQIIVKEKCDFHSTSAVHALGVAVMLFCAAGLIPALAQDTEWRPLTGKTALTDFMSDLTLERILPNGRISRGVYSADGTATLYQWGAKFPRTWEVSAEDQICITSNRITNCYGIEQNRNDPELYRSFDESAGEWVEYRVVQRKAVVKRDPPRRGDQGGPAAASAADVAAELTNPNTAVGILTTLFDYKTFSGSVPGANSQASSVLTFQPSLPYPLAEGRNLFFRPAIPVIFSQPVSEGGEFTDAGTEIGDIGYDAAMGFSFDAENGKNVILAGFAGTIPTATDERIATDQWLLGPEFGYTAVRKWGSAGLLLYHQWDIAGDDTFDTSLSGGQYTYNINLKNAWQITGSPIWSYDHNADNGDALTFPLGIGLAKAIIFKGTPWTMSIEYWNYIEKPDGFGPKHQVRLSIAPVVQLPWKGKN